MKKITLLSLAVSAALSLQAQNPPQPQPAPVPPPPPGQRPKTVIAAFPTLDKSVQVAVDNALAAADNATREVRDLQIFANPGPEPQQTVLVKSSKINPQQESALQEDLAIMARILERTLDENFGAGHGLKAMGIELRHFGEAPTHNYYLEDYGALFQLSVGFPLLPRDKDDKKEDSKSDPKSDWERTKRELYSPDFQDDATISPNGPPTLGPQVFSVNAYGFTHAPVKYDAEKVDQLKTKLLEALKNASNIRNLKPDDYVTLSVSGASMFSGTRFVRLTNRRENLKGGPDRPNNGGTLTIRATKKHIDEFAKGKMSLDEFKNAAKIQIY